MDPQTLILSTVPVAAVSGTAFFWLWIKGVNAKQRDLGTQKLDKEQFNEYRAEANTRRIERDAERDKIQADIKVLYARKHSHEINCNQPDCKPKCGGMMIT